MLETINYKNFSIKIEYDQDPLSPIEDYDCGLSIMACAHRSYNLGNRLYIATPTTACFGMWWFFYAQ